MMNEDTLKLLMGVTSSEVHMVRVLPNHVVAWYGYWFAKEAREEHTVYASNRFSAAFQKELRHPTMPGLDSLFWHGLSFAEGGGKTCFLGAKSCFEVYPKQGSISQAN